MQSSNGWQRRWAWIGLSLWGLWSLAVSAPLSATPDARSLAPIDRVTLPTEPPEFRRGLVLTQPTGAADPEKPVIKLMVSPFAYPNIHYPLIDRTIQELKALYGANNVIAIQSTGDPDDMGDADLILCSAGTYMRMQGKGARDLVTAVSNLAPDPNHAEGSLFITLKSRTDIQELMDMQGKRLVATGPNAFAGLHIGMAEIAKQGFDPDRFFKSQSYVGFDMRKEFAALRHNVADVAVVRTCLLEELQKAGEEVSDIKPIAVKEGIHPGACLSSTELYPNWSMLATPRLDPEEARKITVALLSMMPDKNGLHWSITSDFKRVDSMYKSIRQGPYYYLRNWTLRRFWDEYWQWLVLVVALVLGLAAHSYRTTHLVNLRTQQLKAAMQEQRALEQRALQAQTRMQSMQRAGVVGQMSSIIAHELRQPLSTITSYAHGIARLLEGPGAVDRSLMSQGIEVIASQAEVADAIVKKVRSYAKSQNTTRTEVDVAQLLEAAVSTVNTAQLSEVVVTATLPPRPMTLWGDPLELELALQNLIRNALEALQGRTDGEVHVCAQEERGAQGQPRTVLIVEDNGKTFSETEMSELSGILSSTKIEGLGLGLSIVRLIAESHGGQLEFVRRSPRGLCVRMVLPDGVVHARGSATERTSAQD